VLVPLLTLARPLFKQLLAGGRAVEVMDGIGQPDPLWVCYIRTDASQCPFNVIWIKPVIVILSLSAGFLLIAW